VEYFGKDNSVSGHPDLLKLVQFCFAVPTHNGNVERIFSLMRGEWAIERNRFPAESVKRICTVQYNFKNMSCKKLLILWCLCHSEEK